MPKVNPTCFHVSASSIASFKACPVLFRLRYREGLRPAEDTEAQRMGTNWHAMHETYANVGKECFDNDELQLSAGGCEEAALAAVVELLNTAYDQRPNSKTAEEWALERQILYISLIGYLWYYQEDRVEILYSELPFNLPIHNPKVGLPLPMSEVQRVGKIDHVIRWQGMIGTIERKSTTKAIDPDSQYWNKAAKDTQVSMYALAFRDLIRDGWLMLPAELGRKHGLLLGEARVGNTLYDVWRKPTTKPKFLTQKDTAEFIATGTYFNMQFERYHDPEAGSVSVDGECVEVEPGKKGFAIRESVAMYGARLLADIYERPDHYFVRREIARTDGDLKKFRRELYAIYQAMRSYDRSGHWFENEHQCDNQRKCDYIGVCYGPGSDAVCDGKTTPQGMRRIFVDLTVKGDALPEE